MSLIPRRLALGSAFALLLPCLWATMAAEKTFTLNGTSFVLEDVSAEIQVQYQSMRLNRALNVWNVEVSLLNSGTRTLRGPFLISFESFTGTRGLLQPDGLDSGT